ncbi:endonuclease [Helicobacter pylori Hp A-26]|uniref:Endonuclease n=1 Tax=Helicobacter pylori Hp A-26 TaxID=992056 RepID=I9TS66_HELPX|nr:endonuclease [Helicobacter pylori Hp A-26]
MKEKFDSNEYIFSDEELERIIEISPQQHKDSLVVMTDSSKK